MGEVLIKIENDINIGAFDFGNYFPKTNSSIPANKQGDSVTSLTRSLPVSQYIEGSHVQETIQSSLFFKDFAEKWFNECKIGWRRSYIETIRNTLDKHLIPYFGEKMVSSIRCEDILDFRSQLAKVPGRKGQTLSARRIEAIILGLRQVLNEAADRYHFTTPSLRIKSLRIKRSDISPLTLDEVSLILKTVRTNYRDYLIVRFFLGCVQVRSWLEMEVY